MPKENTYHKKLNAIEEDLPPDISFFYALYGGKYRTKKCKTYLEGYVKGVRKSKISRKEMIALCDRNELMQFMTGYDDGAKV